MYRHLRQTFLVSFLAVVALFLASCDEDSSDPCPAEGRAVDGIQGIVLSPDCGTPFSQANVTANHGSGATVTVESGPDGTFVMSMAQLVESGNWHLTATKGPFNSQSMKQVTVENGQGTFVVFKMH